MEKIKCKNNFDQIVELPKDKFFFRPSVYGIIINKGKIVLLKNKGNGKFWFPGGGVELGEKLEEALKREVAEETGLNIEVGKMVLFKENFFYYQPLDEAYHAFLFFFVCNLNYKNYELILDSKVDDLESKMPRWIKINKVKEEEISDLSSDLYKLLQELDLE
ncbi:NUDIX domain-containing protein [Candidatus Parcubacteria bacterium]|nr:NUDIX domain-containing protein [Candidatus Parcubacteria bacterium]